MEIGKSFSRWGRRNKGQDADGLWNNFLCLNFCLKLSPLFATFIFLPSTVFLILCARSVSITVGRYDDSGIEWILCLLAAHRVLWFVRLFYSLRHPQQDQVASLERCLRRLGIFAAVWIRCHSNYLRIFSLFYKHPDLYFLE